MSRCFRAGNLVEGSITPPGKFKMPDGTPAPVVSFKITSNLDIGLGQTKEETTNIVLVGDAVIDKFRNNAPTAGDELRFCYAVLYHSDVSKCATIRVQSPDELEVIKKTPVGHFMSAEEYFKNLNKGE